MKKFVIALSTILLGCTTGSDGVDVKPVKIVPIAVDSNNCFTDNNHINVDKKLSKGNTSYLFADNLVRGTLGDREVHASEHIRVYLGEVIKTNELLKFIPDNSNDKFADGKKEVQSQISDYISQINNTGHLDMTDFVITAKWSAQYRKILDEFRQNNKGAFAEFNKEKRNQIKRDTPRCVVEMSDVDFINALDISLIQKFSATLSDKK